MRNIYIISGEVSGDTHGAELIESLLQRDSELGLTGLGGPRMKGVASNVEDWLDDAAVLGIWEVLKKYGYFREKMDETITRIEEEQPDLLILIDYPGFNLRLAKALHQRQHYQGKVAYYISPQVWAWKRGRIKEMARTVDCMMCIFPFEAALYEQSGLKTEFVGHPLIDELAPKRDATLERDPKLIGLFPGSRRREIEALFPAMVEAAEELTRKHPDLRFVTAGVNPILSETLAGIADDAEARIDVSDTDIHELMQSCGCAVIASGTATLEAAYFGLPYCLTYKVAWLTAQVAQMVMKVDYLGIVNNLAEREVVEELLQDQATGPGMAKALDELIASEDRRHKLSQEVQDVASMLGDGGCHERAAECALALIEPT